MFERRRSESDGRLLERMYNIRVTTQRESHTSSREKVLRGVVVHDAVIDTIARLLSGSCSSY